MKKKTIYPHELIGVQAEVINSANHDQIGIKGEIVDETKSTITIKQDGKMKKLLKNTIELKLANGEVISGKMLAKRPEDRIRG